MIVKRSCYPVPAGPIDGCRFDSATLSQDDSWKIDIGASLLGERPRLDEWASGQEDPIGSYAPGVVDLPEVRALAREIRERLERGYGVAWVRGLPATGDPGSSALLYLAVGAAMGEVVDTYGRLYDVVDRGESYREKAIPVSQTHHSTGMHTDSSRCDNVPDYVGLFCLRPGESGGGSRVSSAIQAHEALRRRNPRLLEALYRDFFRDIVTPGADRTPEEVLKNSFPVFRYEGGLTMRYMRYWIETGHRIAGVPLEPKETEAMDALDQELARDEHMHRFQLAAGDMLWVANRAVAHDRDAYAVSSAHPRWLIRQWIRTRER